MDGAIHRAAGPGLLGECAKLMGCRTGQAKITGGYSLPAKHVIHTVGPVWHGGNRDELALLAACYRHSLELALENDIRSMAFPCISTGVYRYPKEQACDIAVSTVKGFLEAHPQLDKVIFCCFGQGDYNLYTKRVGVPEDGRSR